MVFNSQGFFQSSFGSSGSGNGQFHTPTDVAVGPTGLIYVVDANNNRIQVFNSAGSFQYSFGSLGAGNGQFHIPYGMAVAPTGMIYVTETSNARVDRLFDPNSWVSGTNTFTDSTVGPTSVSVGSGQLLGAGAVTLNSPMGLVVGNTLSVHSDGTFTQAGGAVSTPTLEVAGSYIYHSGSLAVSTLEVDAGGLFQNNQGGTIAISSPAAIYGELSVDGGATFSAPTIGVGSGGLLAIGQATVSSSALYVSNGGELQLDNLVSSVVQVPSLINDGVVDGMGRINGALTNNADGEVTSAAGQNLTFTGSGNTNTGLVSLSGGVIHFTQDLSNQSTGAIEGFGTLRVDGGLTNHGMLALAGSAGVFGAVTNNSDGTIHLSGTQPNVFFGALNNNGAINIDAGASGIFYGAVTGTGTITNAGAAQFDATSHAGVVSGAGSTTLTSAVTLNANTFTQGGLSLQLAGDTAGSYSKLDVAGPLSLAGKLSVSLVNGFAPAMGNSFDLLDWGTLSGHFSSVTLPALSAGLAWDSRSFIQLARLKW